MFLETWLTWIANHLGLGSVKNATGIRKDLVDTKKAKLEVKKLEDEAEERESPITRATFEDVKTYDPKYKQIREKAMLRQIEATESHAIQVVLIIRAVVIFEIDALLSSVQSILKRDSKFIESIIQLTRTLSYWATIMLLLVLLFRRVLVVFGN